MVHTKSKAKKRSVVLDALFSDCGDHMQILAGHGVSCEELNRMMANDPSFSAEIDRRIAAEWQRASAVIATWAYRSAIKLVQLTEDDDPETARKACLDLMALHKSISDRRPMPDNASKGPAGKEPAIPISSKTAGKMLALLAKDRTPKPGRRPDMNFETDKRAPGRDNNRQ